MPRRVSRSASCSGVRLMATYSRSHESGTSIGSASARELVEEAHVRAHQLPHVADAVTIHGHPVQPEAHRIALEFIRVVAAIADDGRVHHAGAEERDPARAL